MKRIAKWFPAAALFVAALSMFAGCYALSGECIGGGLGPQCTADGAVYDSTADAGTLPEAGGDSDVAKPDSSADAGATPDSAETADTKGEICKEYLWLDGGQWKCWMGGGTTGLEVSCAIETVVLPSGACGVRCPGSWKVQADTIVVVSPNEIVYDMNAGGGPHTCIRQQ